MAQTQGARQDYDEALANWGKIADAVAQCHSDWAKNVLPTIEKVIADTSSADKAEVEASIARLNAIGLRHGEEVSVLVARYETLTHEKQDLEANRAKKKDELDSYDETIFREWEVAINRYLTAFGAGFRFVEAKKNYQGRVPQCQYGIAFEGGTISIGGKEQTGTPSFKTVMSTGDKSTLALAFFLAQLDRDPDLECKIVVFDDPFTSLDEFRREFTAKCVARLAKRASQVIVFSHDKHFLKTSYDRNVGDDPVTLQLSVSKNNVNLENWDMVREVKEGYLRDHMLLVEFSEGLTNDARAMRTLMRPLLEKYIRYRFPNQIADDKWLGDMIGVIRKDANHPLTAVLQELEDINDYTAPFHHDPNAAFDADEVRAHVERTLAIVGGC